MDNQKLEELSIFELRNLARRVGVKNPTILKKNDLISEIYDIQTGKKKPCISNHKQGRPPKEIGGYEKLVGIFLPDDITEVSTKEESIFTSNDNEIVLRQDPSIDENDIRETFIYHGYLEILENGCGLLRKKTTKSENQKELVFVPSKCVNQYMLKNGDEIMCEASIVMKDKPMVLVDLASVNGVDIKDYNIQREDLKDMPTDNYPPVLTFEDSEYNTINNKLKIKYGDTIMCYSETCADYRKMSTKLLKAIEHNFDKIVYLFPILKPNMQENYILQNSEVYSSDFNESFSMQKRISLLAHNRVKRLAENGKKVLFIIDNIISLVGLDKDLKGELPISKSIVSTAKALINGSITMLCSIPNIPQPYIQSMIMSTFPLIETVGLVLQGSEIDIFNSYRNS